MTREGARGTRAPKHLLARNEERDPRVPELALVLPVDAPREAQHRRRDLAADLRRELQRLGELRVHVALAAEHVVGAVRQHLALPGQIPREAVRVAQQSAGARAGDDHFG